MNSSKKKFDFSLKKKDHIDLICYSSWRHTKDHGLRNIEALLEFVVLTVHCFKIIIKNDHFSVNNAGLLEKKTPDIGRLCARIPLNHS